MLFCQEEQASLQSLSEGGKLHLCVKTDLLSYLEEFCIAQTEAPMASSVTVQKAAIIQTF